MNRLITAATLLFTSGAFFAPAAFAADRMDKGRQIAEQQCASCHNTNGVSIGASFPHLAGQYRDYMVQALRDYRSGKRNNAIMNTLAATLSLEDIDAVAAWYASQEPVLGNFKVRRSNPD